MEENTIIQKFIYVTEVDDGHVFADALFQRAYGSKLPDFPHHIVAFYIEPDGAHIPISYVHFTNCGDIFLAGGACTSGDALRRMSEGEQAILRDYGGVMLATLRHGFKRYGPKCQAIFTCCGDSRALATTPKVGFTETSIDYLLVNWMANLGADRKRELIAKAKSFMPF